MTFLEKLQSILKVSLLITGLFGSFPLHAQKADGKTIGITQIVNHPSLNAIRQGIVEALAKGGYREGKNLTVVFEDAQGNPATAAQIARKFASLSLDVVIPISTPSAQAIVQQIKETPIVFAAISDPLEAKVLPSLTHPGGNVTGLADIPPVEEQLNFIVRCLPDLKVLGVIYNPGEVNNISFLKRLKVGAKQKNIQILVAPALKTSDIQAAANSLVGDVDALFIGNDNTVVSGLESLIKVFSQAHKPVFASDPDSVNRGALAAYAYDQRKMGQQVGRMVLEIFKGKNPGTMPVEKPRDIETFMNPRIASILNVHCKAPKPQEETP